MAVWASAGDDPARAVGGALLRRGGQYIALHYESCASVGIRAPAWENFMLHCGIKRQSHLTPLKSVTKRLTIGDRIAKRPKPQSRTAVRSVSFGTQIGMRLSKSGRLSKAGRRVGRSDSGFGNSGGDNPRMLELSVGGDALARRPIPVQPC